MFLARIDGTVVPAAKHATLEGCRFLVAQRLEADGSTGAEPLVVVDLAGRGVRFHRAGLHRRRHCARALWQHHAGAHGGGGNCGPGAGRREGGMRLGIVRGHVTLTPAVPELLGLTLVVLEPVTMANLRAKNGLGGGKSLVAVDALGAARGQMVAFTEGTRGREPFLAESSSGGRVLHVDCRLHHNRECHWKKNLRCGSEEGRSENN